jgi:hypothetical protein
MIWGPITSESSIEIGDPLDKLQLGILPKSRRREDSHLTPPKAPVAADPKCKAARCGHERNIDEIVLLSSKLTIAM